MRIELFAALALLLAGAGSAPARAAGGLTPSAERHLEEALHHLYRLDYAQSRASFRKIAEEEPDNPFPYLFEAGAIWWQSANEYGLFKDTPTLQGLFEQDVEAAIRKADEWQDSKDDAVRADAHFVEGMALGTRGQWNILKGNWMRAYGDGKKAMKHLKKCVKIDPEYYDAYLGLGVFDYQAAHFSGVLRFAGAILGIRGDEVRGLERMTSAMEKGRYASRQAAEFLMTIHFMDRKDFRSALPLARRLRESFPDSVFFELAEAASLHQLGETESSVAVGRLMFERARKDPKGFNRKLLSLVCGLAGERCLAPEIVKPAADWFTAAIDAGPPKGAEAERPGAHGWLSLNRLYRAYTRDLLGQRDEAEFDYRWVLAHRDFGDSHARARECLEKPCWSGPLLSYFRTLSKGETWPVAPPPVDGHSR